MAERFKAPVLKTGMGASPSWVRIPLSPPEPSFVVLHPHSLPVINTHSARAFLMHLASVHIRRPSLWSAILVLVWVGIGHGKDGKDDRTATDGAPGTTSADRKASTRHVLRGRWPLPPEDARR